jgi:hypothetical protein
MGGGRRTFLLRLVTVLAVVGAVLPVGGA